MMEGAPAFLFKYQADDERISVLQNVRSVITMIGAMKVSTFVPNDKNGLHSLCEVYYFFISLRADVARSFESRATRAPIVNRRR